MAKGKQRSEFSRGARLRAAVVCVENSKVCISWARDDHFLTTFGSILTDFNALSEIPLFLGQEISPKKQTDIEKGEACMAVCSGGVRKASKINLKNGKIWAHKGRF